MYVKILPGCLKKKVYESKIAFELLTGNAFEEINVKLKKICKHYYTESRRP
jgi:hypothetical protein